MAAAKVHLAKGLEELRPGCGLWAQQQTQKLDDHHGHQTMSPTQPADVEVEPSLHWPTGAGATGS